MRARVLLYFAALVFAKFSPAAGFVGGIWPGDYVAHTFGMPADPYHQLVPHVQQFPASLPIMTPPVSHQPSQMPGVQTWSLDQLPLLGLGLPAKSPQVDYASRLAPSFQAGPFEAPPSLGLHIPKGAQTNAPTFPQVWAPPSSGLHFPNGVQTNALRSLQVESPPSLGLHTFNGAQTNAPRPPQVDYVPPQSQTAEVRYGQPHSRAASPAMRAPSPQDHSQSGGLRRESALESSTQEQGRARRNGLEPPPFRRRAPQTIDELPAPQLQARQPGISLFEQRPEQTLDAGRAPEKKPASSELPAPQLQARQPDIGLFELRRGLEQTLDAGSAPEKKPVSSEEEALLNLRASFAEIFSAELAID